MFVYEYMGEKFDTIIAALDDEDFDPHKYRNIKHPCTYSETMQHFLKGCLGAGMLAMPNAVSRMGLIFGAVGILGIGVYATYCLQLLIETQYEICKRLRRGYMAYTSSMRNAVLMGPPCVRFSAYCFGALVDFFLAFWQLALCAIYFVFVAENLKQLIDFYNPGVVTVRLLICYAWPLEVAFCMVKNLKIMTPVSTIANWCVAVGLLFTFFYLIEDDIEFKDNQYDIKSVQDIPVFIGITLFALEAVGVILALEYNMEKPKEFLGMCGLLYVAMFFILGIYILLGIAGFLKYGSHCKGSITLNLPFQEKRAQLVKFSFALALLLSYPLQNYVAWQIVWRLIGKKFNNDWKADWVLRAVIATIPFFMAVGAPNLGAFMGLAGALCLSLVAIVFPAIMDICIYYPDKYGFLKYKFVRDTLIIIFGFFCCCSGVYTSILEMAGEEEEE